MFISSEKKIQGPEQLKWNFEGIFLLSSVITIAV